MPQGRAEVRPTEEVAFPTYDWKGMFPGSRLMLPATNEGQSLERSRGCKAPMEWETKNEGPINERSWQPAERIESS